MMLLNKKFLAVENEMNKILIERSAPIRGVLLSAISSTNILLLGPAGIAKSMLINEWNKRITGSIYFEWLLSKFSTPDELFGPISLTGLERERYKRVTTGKLPEANTAFLDEIFKANSSILNALLTILNERKFFNDGVPITVPLVTVAGASNEIPDSDDGLDAFFDRFLLKYHLAPIREASAFIRMLKLSQEPPTVFVSLEDIKSAQQQIEKIVVDETIYSQILKIREAIRKDVGVPVSDRTFKLSMKILKAEAWLNGQPEVVVDNLEIYRHICWTKPEQEKSIHSQILTMISPEKNKILEYYAQVLDMEKELYKKKGGDKQSSVVETSQKLNEARVKIADLKKAVVARKQDVTEIEKIELELEEIQAKIARDILGVEISKLRTKS